MRDGSAALQVPRDTRPIPASEQFGLSCLRLYVTFADPRRQHHPVELHLPDHVQCDTAATSHKEDIGTNALCDRTRALNHVRTKGPPRIRNVVCKRMTRLDHLLYSCLTQDVVHVCDGEEAGGGQPASARAYCCRHGR